MFQKCLPKLRQLLLTNKMSIDGVKPPPPPEIAQQGLPAPFLPATATSPPQTDADSYNRVIACYMFKTKDFNNELLLCPHSL